MKKVSVGRLIAGCALGLFLLSPLNQVFGELKGKLVIFHAGSLTIPFEKMENEFEAQYPRVDVLREPAGSVKCARKITELKKPCDIMASADFTVIDRFLIPEYADWSVRFATNQLVLCYTEMSKFSDTVSQDNWFDILSTEGVIWGHADPNLDPCGYRSLMVLQLAEKYYQNPELYQKCIDNRPKENIRPKSVGLVSLLQTGNMDYAFEYLSVAIQHNLKFIKFPDEINLGIPDWADFYGNARVKISGEKPGEYTEIQGKPIVYGVTLLNHAPQKDIAVTFLEYLLSPEGGLRILDEMGQPSLVPLLVTDEAMKDKLPIELQKLVSTVDG